MAVEFWVLASSIQQTGSAPGYPDVSLTNKASVGGDESSSWATAAAYYGSRPWRLIVTPASVTTQHGAITQVRLYARMFTSQAGPSQWYDDGFPWPAPHYAPFTDFGGSETYHLPETYAGNYRGIKIYGNVNRNNPGVWAPNTVAWDITSQASWSDSVIAAMKFGIACDNGVIAYNQYSGLNEATYGSMSAPLFHVSQLVLRVNADDPPPAAALVNQGMIGE